MLPFFFKNKVQKARTLFESIDAEAAKQQCPQVYDYLTVYLAGFDADPATFQSMAEGYVSQP